MSETIQLDRRHFLGTAVTAIAGAGLLGSRFGESERWSLGVRHAEVLASNRPAVILLHGDSRGIDSGAATLTAMGYRVIAPRGEQTAAPADVNALMAELKIEKALVCGIGESARTAEIAAALWPQHLKGIAQVGGSGAVTLAPSQRPLPPQEELAWWYQYYFNGEA